MQTPIITLDEETLKGELRDLVRKTVEEVINGILDAQADELVNAGRYERTDERQAYRSGHYARGLLTQAGRIEVSVPKLRGARFTTEVIERYRRREESVEEALMEMYLLGVSTRNVEDVTKILWDEGVSAGTISNPSQGPSRKSTSGGTARSRAAIPTSTWTAPTSRGAGEAPTRAWPCSWR